MISTWPGATLLVTIEVFYPSQNLVLCAESWFFTEYALNYGGTNCAKMSCGNVFRAVVSLHPSPQQSQCESSNWVMNSRYRMDPQSFFFFICCWTRERSWWRLQLNVPLKFTVGITSGCCDSLDILQTWLCSFSSSSWPVDEDAAILDDMAEINTLWIYSREEPHNTVHIPLYERSCWKNVIPSLRVTWHLNMIACGDLLCRWTLWMNYKLYICIFFFMVLNRHCITSHFFASGLSHCVGCHRDKWKIGKVR